MNDLKIIFIGFAFMIIFIGIITDYLENKVALQNGYIQKVVNHKVIWVKPDCNITKKEK